MSVLLDPIRAMRVFGLEAGGSFSPKVLYIYQKQIEEADLLVISKCDLMENSRLEVLRQAIAGKFPAAPHTTMSNSPAHVRALASAVSIAA